MTRSEIVGANIYKYRTSLGMSQSTFADLIGRSQTMVTNNKNKRALKPS